jgi:heavy metal sensor kinase
MLLRHAGHVVTRKMLCEHLWESDWEGTTNVIEVHINRLRNVHTDVSRQGRLVLAAGVLILVVAPVVGYWLAGRATRPLAAMLRTAGRLRPDHLDERLPLHGTGDELDRLADTINGLLDRLAEHVARQREFTANAAHDLRSPLAALRTAIEVALDQERSPEEYRDLLGELAEDCQGLSVLVNQLLLLAEGDAGRLQPGSQVVRLDQLVTRSADMFRGVAESRGVELLTPVLAAAAVCGDATHLRQVIHNLIDNAIKYTPSGGKITVAVDAGGLGLGLGQAVLRVEDTGTGITAEALPQVFDRFFRADRSRSGGGSGLGLSICQAIVTAHGGQIIVESSAGGGTCVTVTLPLAAPARVSDSRSG